MFNLQKYKSQLKSELTKQLETLELLEFPVLQSIEGFDINDEILRKGAKGIRLKYNLPQDGDQIIYMMTLEGFPEDRNHFIDVIEEIGLIKSKFSHELSQITSINKENFKYHKDRNDEVIVMYIGTSQTFASRVQTHAGFGSRGTATVCLKRWPIFQNDKIKFSFKYFNFGKDLSPETLKFFEYYLSRDLRPLIGHNRRS